MFLDTIAYGITWAQYKSRKNVSQVYIGGKVYIILVEILFVKTIGVYFIDWLTNFSSTLVLIL